MAFSVSTLAFADEPTAAINKIRKRLLGLDPPPSLFHYTSGDTSRKIANTRVLRATCVANLGDKEEIGHGAALVRDEIDHFIRAGHSGFPAEIFRRSGKANQTERTSFCCVFLFTQELQVSLGRVRPLLKV